MGGTVEQGTNNRTGGINPSGGAVFYGVGPNGTAQAFRNGPNGVQPVSIFDYFGRRGAIGPLKPKPQPMTPLPVANTVLSGRGPEAPTPAPAPAPTAEPNQNAIGGFAAILRMLLGQ